MSEQNKIFEDFPTVDCNDCEHWWTNQCDGVKTSQNASKTLCRTFKATRSVVIPEQIKWLKTRLKLLTVALAVLAAVQIILLGAVIISGTI